MVDVVLVVSPDCRLCDRARALLRRLEVSFREVDLADDEAAELAAAGVPVIFFPVLVVGGELIAYGDIGEGDVHRALVTEATG